MSKPRCEGCGATEGVERVDLAKGMTGLACESCVSGAHGILVQSRPDSSPGSNWEVVTNPWDYAIEYRHWDDSGATGTILYMGVSLVCENNRGRLVRRVRP